MGNKRYEKTIKLNGVDYICRIVNGEKFIEGKTIEKFYDSLNFQTRLELAMLGVKLKNEEVEEENAQDVMNEFYKIRNN